MVNKLVKAVKKIVAAPKKRTRNKWEDPKTTKDLVNLLKDLSQPKHPPEVPDLLEWLNQELKKGIKWVQSEYGKMHPRWTDGWATGATWLYSQVVLYYELQKIRHSDTIKEKNGRRSGNST